MKPRILQLLVFVLLVGTWGFAEALEPLKLYDNFEQAPINSDKWFGSQFEAPPRFGGSFLELVRKTTPEEHHLRILSRSFGDTRFTGGTSLSLFRLGFTHPDTITAIRSRVQVRNVESTGCPASLNPIPTVATAQIFGFFFNTIATVPGNGTNDVIAGVQLQRRSDSTDPPDILEISYSVNLCLDPDCVGISPLGGGVLGTVKTGEWVRLLLQWDRLKHRFIFQRDRETPGVVRYQEGGLSFSDAAAPGIQLKTLGADHFIPTCATDLRPVGMVDALFDNVFVNQRALP
jgi:hypothetical protein